MASIATIRAVGHRPLDVTATPLTAIHCTTLASPGDRFARPLPAFDMDAAAASLHAEGIVSTPLAPAIERRTDLAARMANAARKTSARHAG